VVLAINASVRHDDEWFDEEDEVHRIEKILGNLQMESDPLIAAALATGRIARSQAFPKATKERRCWSDAGFWIAMVSMGASSFRMMTSTGPRCC
jgi:hypothetical protein